MQGGRSLFAARKALRAAVSRRCQNTQRTSLSFLSSQETCNSQQPTKYLPSTVLKLFGYDHSRSPSFRPCLSNPEYLAAHQRSLWRSSLTTIAGEGKSNGGSESGEEGNGGGIAVDRSGLFNVPEHGHEPRPGKSDETVLTKHLKALIRFRTGPITVAEYMEEVLTNPMAGFYMYRDVFGTHGDFVTSPEVSQMFGEMIGVWTVTLWQQMGSPPKVRLVELGPGRGTLMADLLRGTAVFKQFAEALEVHLVEVSPALRKLQYDNLRCKPLQMASPDAEPVPKTHESSQESLREDESVTAFSLPSEKSLEDSAVVQSCISGASVTWHSALESVPEGVPTIILAHEFVDALPVHQFQMTENGWREKLVDVAEDDSPHHFRFVLAPIPTPATNLYLKKRLGWVAPLDEEEVGPQVEVCPGALRLVADIARRVGKDGGGALIIDYGENKLVQDSLQAIRKHQFVHVLDAPGTADLSAYVDFQSLICAVQETRCGATAYGPVAQNRFLHAMGINFRAEALAATSTPEQQQDLQRGYWRLMGEGQPAWEEDEDGLQAPHGMGTRYMALAITQDSLGPPAGFL